MAYLCHIGPKIGVKKTENLYKKIKESVAFFKKNLFNIRNDSQ